jgi:two-component system, NtrC family, response regulator
VMLLGESGTGKEILARGLHQASPRKRQRFVAINCAAIPDNLLESELFGFEKGAFTGAIKTTPGKIESADGGTLMLDEIGDLPFNLQAKLLRFLQERTVERVGGRQEIAVDVRVVCATHQDLQTLCKEGRFREDLYYRLAEVVIAIPPLRARTGDAALLAHALLRRYAADNKRPALRLSDEAVHAVEAHHWPGNIRELENRLKRAAIMADGTQVSRADMDLGQVDSEAGASSLDLRQARDQAERSAILAALGRVNGNMARAAELLGISRPTLYDLMHRLCVKQVTAPHP